MFRDLVPGPIAFASPWDQEQLTARLSGMMSGTGHKVAYLYGTPDSSTFRYRVFNMVQALNHDPDRAVSACWFSIAEIRMLRDVVGHLDTIVLARVRYSQDVADLITCARAFGVTVLFECDDLVFDIRFAHLISVNNDQAFSSEAHLENWYAYVGRLNTTALHCDGGITTNAFLAEKLADVCGKNVAVVPNFLNRNQEKISRILFAEKLARGFQSDGRIMLGYFSGSPTHNRDFRVALASIIRLMEEDEDVGIRIVGFLEGHSELDHFGDRVDRIDLQDWVNLQVKIAEVDLNIAPLQQNDFTNCKSELKYFEAAAVGTYSVLSRTYTFHAAMGEEGRASVIENGFWYKALKDAVALVRSPEEYVPVAKRAAGHVYECYGWDRNLEAIKRAVLR